MKHSTISSIGGLQSLLFCVGMYFVALFFSIFVCSSVFYAINPKKKDAMENTAAVVKPQVSKQTYASVER